MDDYSQPDFYRFNSDSLELVKFIEQSGIHAHSILDLGAGSGVIGIELARKLKAKELTLVELQNDYEVHLKRNAEFFLDPDIHCEIILKSFGEFGPRQKYDLIVCNPPYYLPHSGEIPKDPRRALARSFLKDSITVLLDKISDCLLEEGKAYLVLKHDSSILGELHSDRLGVKRHPRQQLVFVELFTLNKNRNEGSL